MSELDTLAVPGVVSGMSIQKITLAKYLTETILLLKNTPKYSWGNSGSCNCGHLAQVMTGKKGREIHQVSMAKEGKDWTERAQQYCQDSGHKVDEIISTMLGKGLRLEDIEHIEYLSHPEILKNVSSEAKPLIHHKRQDVIVYFEAWIKLLLSTQKAGNQIWVSKQAQPSDVAEEYDTIPEFAS